MKYTKLYKKILPALFIITCSLFITSCYSWFEEKTPIQPLSTENLSGLFDTTEIVEELAAPSQLFVSQGSSSKQIELSWSVSEGATSYRIERAVITPAEDGKFTLPTDDEYEIVQKFVYSTNYSDTILTNPSYNNVEYNNLYFYRVSADNISKGLESSPFTRSDLEPSEENKSSSGTKKSLSDITTASCCGWLLPSPKEVEAWKGKSTSEIKLTWQPVENARYYKIYRGRNSNGTNMEQIASVLGNATSYTNQIIESEQGVEFYYKITAQLSNGIESAFSALALGFSLKPGAPSAPANVHTENSLGTDTSSISVKWDTISYVPTKPSLELTYSLYRTSSEDSVFTLVKNKIDPNTTSYTDSVGLKPGIYYYYYLQSVAADDSERIQSAFSESGPKDTATPAMGFLLSYPTNVEVTAIDGDKGKLKIRWSPAIGSEISGITYKYNIYCCNEQEGTYSILHEKIDGTLASDGYLEFTVDKKPFYKVSTVNSSATESSLSYAVAPCPDAPVNIIATKNEKLTGADFQPNTLGVYPVKITWKKPSTDNPAGYHVYRSTKPDSDFRKVTTSPVSELSYIDNNETAKAGTFYYYKVVSVNVLGQGKYGNNPQGDVQARGYGALTAIQFFREYNKTLMNSQKKLTYMHKKNDLDKLGTETVNGTISGTLYYTAGTSGYVTMTYTDYCDYYIGGDPALGKLFIMNGNTDTKIEGNLLSKNGHMQKAVEVTGMYRGTVTYNNVEIKSGAAGGGYYGVTTKNQNGEPILSDQHVDWKVGEEGRK